MDWRPPCPTPLCFVGMQFLSILTNRIAEFRLKSPALRPAKVRHYYKQNRHNPKGLTDRTSLYRSALSSNIPDGDEWLECPVKWFWWRIGVGDGGWKRHPCESDWFRNRGHPFKFEDSKNLSQSLHSSKIHFNENRSSRLPGEILISSD